MLPDVEMIYLIYDNASPHVNAQVPKDFTKEFEDVVICRTPPDFPILNPIEMDHFAFKGCREAHNRSSAVAGKHR